MVKCLCKIVTWFFFLSWISKYILLIVKTMLCTKRSFQVNALLWQFISKRFYHVCFSAKSFYAISWLLVWILMNNLKVQPLQHPGEDLSPPASPSIWHMPYVITLLRVLDYFMSNDIWHLTSATPWRGFILHHTAARIRLFSLPSYC